MEFKNIDPHEPMTKTARHALKAHVEGSICDTRDVEFKVIEN